MTLIGFVYIVDGSDNVSQVDQFYMELTITDIVNNKVYYVVTDSDTEDERIGYKSEVSIDWAYRLLERGYWKFNHNIKD